MRKFYASYGACLRGFLDRRSNPAKQAPLTYVRVHGFWVDISVPTTCRFAYGAEYRCQQGPLTLEFYYRLDVIKQDHFQRDKNVRETTKRWIPHHIFVDREDAYWVLDTRSVLNKSNRTFVATFLWLLVRHRLSPTSVDNILTLHRAVLVSAMVAGFEINFQRFCYLSSMRGILRPRPLTLFPV